jgi:hypothetical protein
MALYEINSENLSKISQTSFDQVGLRERTDLQRLLKNQIEVISQDTLIIAEEFGEWEESKRRIDLLGLDKNANLVVIELKRTEDGGHMELQAIRYAAMISTMTFERVVDIYSRYLIKINSVNKDAKSIILDFLEWEEPDEDLFAQDVRIILVSANFSKELTTAVMWLNKRDLDIRCIRVIPYQDNGRILIDVQQVIPLPEVAEYQIQIREKEQEGRKERAERYSLRRKFWVGLLNLAEEKTQLHSNISPSEYSWIGMGAGVRGLSFNYSIQQHSGRVELYIDRSEANVNKAIFDELYANKDEIEALSQEPLSWQRLDSKRACRIAIEITNGGYRDDELNWEQTQNSMIDAMIRLEKALAPFISNLNSVR